MDNLVKRPHPSSASWRPSPAIRTAGTSWLGAMLYCGFSSGKLDRSKRSARTGPEVIRRKRPHMALSSAERRCELGDFNPGRPWCRDNKWRRKRPCRCGEAWAAGTMAARNRGPAMLHLYDRTTFLERLRWLLFGTVPRRPSRPGEAPHVATFKSIIRGGDEPASSQPQHGSREQGHVAAHVAIDKD